MAWCSVKSTGGNFTFYLYFSGRTLLHGASLVVESKVLANRLHKPFELSASHLWETGTVSATCISYKHECIDPGTCECGSIPVELCFRFLCIPHWGLSSGRRFRGLISQTREDETWPTASTRQGSPKGILN